MVEEHPLHGIYTPIVTFSDNLISCPNVVSRSLPRIISYLLFVYLLTWHFHLTILVALNSSKKKFIFTFFEVVNSPAWFSHMVLADSFHLSFDVSLTITMVELLLLSNIIRKFLKFALPLWVFIHPRRIGEY